MAVVSVNEVSHGRRLRDDYQEDSGRREFVVILSLVSDGPDVARTADDGSTAIPPLKDPHPDNTGLLVASVDPQPTDSRLVWMVVVEYSSTPDIFISDPADPTDAPWDISWGFENEEVIVEKTKTDTTAIATWGVAAGEALDNSVGDVFIPPPTENKARLICTLVKNKASFDVAEAEAYMNTMNDAAVTIAGHTAAKWAAKVIEYSGVKTWKGDTAYWVVKYRVLFDKETFLKELLNVGLQELVGGKKGKIKNALDGSLSDEGEKLDAAGAQTATAYYWQFGTLLEKTFATLNLPTTM